MDYKEEPNVWFQGNERYWPQYGKKVCIDWSKNKIRMSLILRPEHNHPNIKKTVQTYVDWFPLDSELLNFDVDGVLQSV